MEQYCVDSIYEQINQICDAAFYNSRLKNQSGSSNGTRNYKKVKSERRKVLHIQPISIGRINYNRSSLTLTSLFSASLTISFQKHFSLKNLNKVINKNLPTWRAHSHRAQLALLASLSARFNCRASRSVLFGFCALRSILYSLHTYKFIFPCNLILKLKLIFNIVDVNYIFSKLLNLFLISNKKGNSIYLRLYQP